MENLKFSVVDSFDQIQLLNQECELLVHMDEMKKAGTLPAPPTKDDPLPPLKTFHIPKGALEDYPMMMKKAKEVARQEMQAEMV